MSAPCYAKSALNEEQLDVKLAIGCDGIEIQLLQELDRLNSCDKVIEALHLKDFLKYPIRVIHSPLNPGINDTLLEELLSFSGIELMSRIFEIANYFGEHFSTKIPVIIHSETYLSKLRAVNDSYAKLLCVLGDILCLYPMTQLLIENVTPLRNMSKDAAVRFCNNCTYDNIELVKALREDLGSDRIGLVLDTCHQMITYRCLAAVYQVLDETPIPLDEFTMSKYIENYAPYLGLMHVCDIKDSGYGPGRHGIAFTDGTYSKLSAILNIKEIYAPDCPMTLEIAETDFLTCDNYKQTKELVERYYGREIRYGS